MCDIYSLRQRDKILNPSKVFGVLALHLLNMATASQCKLALSNANTNPSYKSGISKSFLFLDIFIIILNNNLHFFVSSVQSYASRTKLMLEKVFLYSNPYNVISFFLFLHHIIVICCTTLGELIA